MRNRWIPIASFLLAFALSPVVRAQDKTKSDDHTKAEVQTTPVKVQITFTEYDGDKKTKSLPYVMYMNPLNSDDMKGSNWVRFRIGTRVPIYTGKNEMQYQDFGTNVDARSAFRSDGHLLLEATLERGWVDGEVSIPIIKADASTPDATNAHYEDPVIRTFRSTLDLNLREGQTIESNVATDPSSGKVTKVEISFTTVK